MSLFLHVEINFKTNSSNISKLVNMATSYQCVIQHGDVTLYIKSLPSSCPKSIAKSKQPTNPSSARPIRTRKKKRTKG